MSSWFTRTGSIAACAVVAGIALLVVAGARTSHPPAQADPPRQAPVASVTRSCPAFTTSKPGAQTIGAASIAQDEFERGGRRTAHRLPGNERVDDLSQRRRGAWAVADVASSQAVVLRATGAKAPGSVAFSASEAGGKDGGGLAVGDCESPRRDQWFVGAGSTLEHRTALVLTNGSDSPAVVDLALLGQEGPVEAAGGDDVLVKPRSVKTIQVRDLAAGEDELAVHAAVTRGALSVAAVDVMKSAQGAGSEWIPSAEPPARTQTLEGVGSGKRTLVLANPGTRTATVKVQVIGKDGTFTSNKLDEVDVPPQSVKTEKVPSGVGGEETGLALSANLPVTAGVRAVTGGAGADTSYTAARPLSDGSLAMPLDLGAAVGPDDATLLLAGQPDQDSRVSITGYDAGGHRLGRTQVTVRAGTTTSFDPTRGKRLGSRAGKLAYLTIDPGTVSLSATARYETGAGVSTVPLRAAPTTIPAPAARPGP